MSESLENHPAHAFYLSFAGILEQMLRGKRLLVSLVSLVPRILLLLEDGVCVCFRQNDDEKWCEYLMAV